MREYFKAYFGTICCGAMRQTFVKLVDFTLNILLFVISIYILLFIKPLNLIALMSAVLCPIAMTFRYRGIKIGRWLCALNGFYLLVFYSISLLSPLIVGMPIADSPRDLFVAFLGTASSSSLLVHCFAFGDAESRTSTRNK